MNASKTSAFISGIAVAIIGIYVENNNLPFILAALVFFSTVIVFVVGFEIWREFIKGEHIGFPFGPKDKKGWAIYGRAWLRMLIWFVGAAMVMLVLSIWKNI
jgi:hypothetical membrane protein